MTGKIRTVFVVVWASLSVPCAAAYQEIAVEHGGTISGQVFVQGTVPAPGFLPVHKNRDVCGDRVPDESLQVAANGAVRNVAVILDGVRVGKAAPSPPAVLDNRDCAFVPRVQTVRVGQILELRNSDPILHDAHARLNFTETLFNLGLPVWRRVQRELREPGLIVVDCEVLHTWMRAYLVVTEHPYATVTGADGRFALDLVPPGHYQLRLWHERLGTQEVPVSISPGQQISLLVTYPPLPSSRNAD